MVLFNAVAGVLFGWLYWRGSQEAAIIFPFLFHVPLIVLALVQVTVLCRPVQSGTFFSATRETSYMPDIVLVAFDGSPLSERALSYALDTFPDAAITTIYVIDPVDSVIAVEAGGLPVAESWYDDAQEQAEMVHTTASELAADHGTDLETVTEIGRPAPKILDYADDNDVDQIVVGSHGRSGIDRVLLGSVAETVTRRAQIPVTVVA